jgi:hypothetical protein
MALAIGFAWLAITIITGISECKQERQLNIGFYSGLVISNVWFAAVVINFK